jgi:hypothetical protein
MMFFHVFFHESPLKPYSSGVFFMGPGEMSSSSLFAGASQPLCAKKNNAGSLAVWQPPMVWYMKG